MKASSLLLIGILGIHVPWLDSGPGSPSRFVTEIFTAAGDLSFRYGFYGFKRKIIIVTHKVFIIAFNMSMKYQLSYLMALAFLTSYCALLTGFVPRPFGFSCLFLRFQEGRIRALNLRCMNEASQMFVVGVNWLEKNVNVTSGGFKIEEGCGNSVVDLPNCSKSRSSPLCSSWSFGTADYQQWITDDACMHG